MRNVRRDRGQSFLTLPSPLLGVCLTAALKTLSSSRPACSWVTEVPGHVPEHAHPQEERSTSARATTRHSQASYKEHEAGGTARPSKSLCEINVLPTATLLCYSVIVRRVVHIKLRNRECVDEAFQSTEAPKSGARSVRLRAFRYLKVVLHRGILQKVTTYPADCDSCVNMHAKRPWSH